MNKRESNLIKWKVRLHKLENNGRNVDSPGIVNKLRRKIRKAEENESTN